MKSPKELLVLAVECMEDDQMVGICAECGATKDNVEPDAGQYKCDECGQYAVYGAETIVLLMGQIAVKCPKCGSH